MWYLLPTILCISYSAAQGFQRPQSRLDSLPLYSLNPAIPNGQSPGLILPGMRNFSKVLVRSEHDPAYPIPFLFPSESNLRKELLFNTDDKVADGNFPETGLLIDPKDSHASYYEELEEVESFATFLKRHTHIHRTSGGDDAVRQFDALLAVLLALAKTVRGSCNDPDLIYEQAYVPTVEIYYKFGLANADKVAVMVEEYIKRGDAHMSKIKKLKQDLCETDAYCSVTLENKIKNNPLVYMKEVETLEALVHLTKSYYNYADEFNEVAQKEAVLPYLLQSKDRLKPYIMHIVNSVEHLSENPVKCI